MFEWEEYFEPHILERGRNYARRGAVQHINKQGDIIEAVVAGSEYYKVKLRYDGHFFSESYCSCPYAAGGSFCKHMAAVLYETDAGNEENHVQEEKTYAFCNEKDGISIVDLISSADRSQLEGMLLELAASDYKVESRIRAGMAGVSGTSDLTEMKNEIDNIFYAYSGRGNYIDYYGAMSFESDLTTYLRNETNRLFDDGEFYTAFELSMYAYVKLGNWDIDDDGEIAMISSCCYEIWQKAAWNCSDLERTLIKEWFLEHSEDGTVIDYMEDVLQNFLRYELASKEELREEIRQLDVLIEESKGSNTCKSMTNMIIHADYHVNGVLKVIKKDNCFEFSNPGNLKLPLAQIYQGGNSKARNPRMQTILRMIGYGDNIGSGFPTILDAWNTEQWRKPDLYDNMDLNQVELKLWTVAMMPEECTKELQELFGEVTYQHLSKEEQITLGTALLEETVTNARLQNIFDLHPTDIGKILFGLVEKNMLVSDSKGRWTSYKINRQYEKTPEQLYITDIEQEQPALNATDQVIYDFIRANGMITTQQVIEITGITTQQGANVALRRLIDKGLIKMVKKGLHYYYMAI